MYALLQHEGKIRRGETPRERLIRSKNEYGGDQRPRQWCSGSMDCVICNTCSQLSGAEIHVMLRSPMQITIHIIIQSVGLPSNFLSKFKFSKLFVRFVNFLSLI